MTKRQLEKLFSAQRSYRYRARNILLGCPQGITNPKRLASQRAYQNNYRKAHRAAANLASKRYYDRHIRGRIGSTVLNRYIHLSNHQSELINTNKELYAAIEKQLDPKGRGEGLKKLLQLSHQFGARRAEACYFKSGKSNPSVRRSLDLQRLSREKRRLNKGKDLNGGKARHKVSTSKKV